MANLQLKDLKKSYGDLEILHGINLDIKSGEFVVFVGPSGCGKSTLLRAIAGLEQISGGTLEIDGTVVNDMPPSERGIAMVFQSYALYPHMTVYDNMAFGLRLAKKSRQEIDQRVKNAADILQLGPYLDRLPKALSGGQRQRVAIGRAICRDPKVFLFDEPLSNLDAALRVATRIEIAKLGESMPDTTMIYVTHDQVEAMTLADRIVVLKDGYVEQVGSPMDLYLRPGNLFVAQFIGSPAMNIMPAKITKAGKTTEVDFDYGGTASVPVETPSDATGQPISFGVRPEHLVVVKDGEALFDGTVDYVEQLGEVQLIYLDIGRQDDPLVAKLPGHVEVKRGEAMRFGAAADTLHIFDKDGRSFSRERLSVAAE